MAQRSRECFPARTSDRLGGGTGGLARALETLRAGSAWRRLEALQPRIVARELPLAVAAKPGDGGGPTAGIVGTLDLLYRDPDSNDWVVADFKSDDLDSDADVTATLDLYAPQLRAYGEAVRRALVLDRTPRLELWLLSIDRIAPLPAEATEPPESR